jgi:hypothetical protein
VAWRGSADPRIIVPLPALPSEPAPGLWLAPLPTVDVQPCGDWALHRARARWDQAFDRVAPPLRALQQRYRLAVGNDRLHDPRGPSSRMTCWSACGADAAASILDVAVPDAGTATGRHGAITRCGPLRWEAADREHRMPVVLHIPWSRPALPMWLSVQQDRGSSCTLHLFLRSRRRLRYPARYFSAGQRALTELRDVLALGADATSA